MSFRRSIPDFAGVALADILANGVAMLIIVVVLTIMARTEHEKRYAEKVEEVSTVMARKFSTSLVLNTLAASKAARLHHYEADPMDLNPSLDLMPILEFHRDYVREYYSGTLWPRARLLERPNGLDAFLQTFTDEQKQGLRADVYDIGQYYLALAILREHGMQIMHWHFLTGHLARADAAHCPPGIAAKDCLGALPQQPQQRMPAPTVARRRPVPGDGGWPPPGAFAGPYGRGLAAAPLPGGTTPSGAYPFGHGAGRGLPAAPPGNDQLGSFPPARPPGEGRAGQGLPGTGSAAGHPRPTLFRMALPGGLRGAMRPESEPQLARILAAIMGFLGELQNTLDAGGTPAPLVPQFANRFRTLLEHPPDLSAAQQTTVSTLAMELFLASRLADPLRNLGPLSLHAGEADAGPGAQLALEPNHLLQEAAFLRHSEAADELPDSARISIALNAYPAIWRGLRVQLEPGGALMALPDPQHPERLGWRAVAYISPQLDDFIVGFAYARNRDDGRLLLQASDNRVRLDGLARNSVPSESALGARGWMMALFGLLLAGLLALFLTRRLVARPA